MKNILTLVLLVTILIGNATKGNAATLHLVSFFDNTSDISDACKKDHAMMVQATRDAADAISFEFVVTTGIFSPSELRNRVNSFSCDTTDIVVFYYSGHGFNETTSTSVFPFLSFALSNATVANSIGLEQIHSQLKAKKPRLLITLGDLCNQFTKYWPNITLATPETQTGYHKLFLQNTGDIIVTSSKTSQLSGCNANSGSFFTLGFLAAMENSIASGSASWEQLLNDAKTRTMSYYRQEPFYVVNVQYRTLNTSAEGPMD